MHSPIRSERFPAMEQEPVSPAPDPPAADEDLQRLPGLPKIISFATLSRCGDEIWIENEGQVYRLRRTRQGKLILTK